MTRSHRISFRSFMRSVCLEIPWLSWFVPVWGFFGILTAPTTAVAFPHAVWCMVFLGIGTLSVLNLVNLWNLNRCFSVKAQSLPRSDVFLLLVSHAVFFLNDFNCQSFISGHSNTIRSAFTGYMSPFFRKSVTLCMSSSLRTSVICLTYLWVSRSIKEHFSPL